MDDGRLTDSALRSRVEEEATCGAHVPPGWWPNVLLAVRLLDAAYPGYRIEQAKEKFGGLRLYITPAPFPTPRPSVYPDGTVAELTPEVLAARAHRYEDDQLAIATAAERACRGRCEVCGAPAETSAGDGSWLRTLCPGHAGR